MPWGENINKSIYLTHWRYLALVFLLGIFLQLEVCQLQRMIQKSPEKNYVKKCLKFQTQNTMKCHAPDYLEHKSLAGTLSWRWWYHH